MTLVTDKKPITDLESCRKRQLSRYQSVNLMSLSLLLLFLGLGVYQFFFKSAAYWPLILMGIMATGLLLSSWYSQQLYKAYQSYWQAVYLPRILEDIQPNLSYQPADRFDLQKIPGLYSTDSNLELTEATHYIKGPLSHGLELDFIQLKILEWQGKRRKKSTVRFEGLFLRIEGLADAKAVAEHPSLETPLNEVGKLWGLGADLRASSDNALLLYIYTEKAFWDGRPNEHLRKDNIPQILKEDLNRLLDFITTISKFA